jgi:DNA-directed RNA polymerase subunit RPC12/RpoP
MLDAKCPKCDKTAEVNDEMTEVNCSYCLTKISYEKYLEIMKEKALNMGIEFQNNWDKNPYSL